jgi:hypothetical protein
MMRKALHGNAYEAMMKTRIDREPHDLSGKNRKSLLARKVLDLEGERLGVDNLTQRKRRRRRRKKKNQLRRRRKRRKRKARGRGEAVARLRLVEIGGVEVEEEVVFEEGVDNSGLL